MCTSCRVNSSSCISCSAGRPRFDINLNARCFCAAVIMICQAGSVVSTIKVVRIDPSNESLSSCSSSSEAIVSLIALSQDSKRKLICSDVKLCCAWVGEVSSV